jgi:hypothetical protein
MSDENFLNAEIQIKSVNYHVSLSVASTSNKNELLCLELRKIDTVDTWLGSFESNCRFLSIAFHPYTVNPCDKVQ